jgi:hypothetical protein
MHRVGEAAQCLTCTKKMLIFLYTPVLLALPFLLIVGLFLLVVQGGFMVVIGGAFYASLAAIGLLRMVVKGLRIRARAEQPQRDPIPAGDSRSERARPSRPLLALEPQLATRSAGDNPTPGGAG